MSVSVLARRHYAVVAVIACLCAGPVQAATTYQQVVDWLGANAGAPADGLAAGTYGVDRLAELGVYLPPGYVEELNFPQLTIEVVETRHYAPHAAYAAATAQFGGQATLAADGDLENYTAGLPFANETILAASPEQAGAMTMWNQVHRWQHYGYKVHNQITFIQPTADGRAGTLLPGMEGGGNVDRHLAMFYHRVYLSKVATLPGQDYRIDVDGADEFLFKEYIEMLEPFDIAGLKMVIERPLEQADGDQVNSYLPTERRVRRLSAKERADSWVGTQWTLDDFEGFSGLVMDNTWRYVGRKVMLHVANAREPLIRYHGPMSTIPLDRWQLRPCFVVEGVPRWKDHPYGRRLLFIDEETYTITHALIFDRADNLTKVFTTVYAHGDEAEPAPEMSTPRWQSTVAIGLVERSANIARALEPSEYVAVEPSEVRKLFSVSNLSSGR